MKKNILLHLIRKDCCLEALCRNESKAVARRNFKCSVIQTLNFHRIKCLSSDLSCLLCLDLVFLVTFKLGKVCSVSCILYYQKQLNLYSVYFYFSCFVIIFKLGKCWMQDTTQPVQFYQSC